MLATFLPTFNLHVLVLLGALCIACVSCSNLLLMLWYHLFPLFTSLLLFSFVGAVLGFALVSFDVSGVDSVPF